MTPHPRPSIRRAWPLVALLPALSGAWAQPTQVVRPPQSQAWIDISTYSGMGLPPGMAMPGMAGGGAPDAGAAGGGVGSLLGGLMAGGRGGAAPANRFGNTQAMAVGRWMDVTLYTRANPNLSEAQQNVPPGLLSPALKLQAPREAPRRPAPEPGDERTVEPEYERPKGKLHLYWGCGAEVRAGQPRTLDFATATPQELGQFFQARSATQRGTHSTPGRPVWPSRDDTRMIPDQASLVGEHGFSGQGVPDGFRFQITAAQDLMPPIALRQQPAGGAVNLEWQNLPTARGYFLAAMGSRGGDEMVLWTSSELPDSGFGLIDYQTNGAVDRWLREKVLLPAGSTRCSVPSGVFADRQGAMLRMVAYGNELNVAHPPRPTDPRVAWEPVWAAKVRVKSVAMAMLGDDSGGAMAGRGDSAPAAAEKSPAAEAKDAVKETVKDALRGLFKR
ncbi:MAG: hypothetical protein ACKVQR_17800 [Aquabacterium sp.]